MSTKILVRVLLCIPLWLATGAAARVGDACATFVGTSPPVCNCTDGVVEAQVCNTESVTIGSTVSVGATVGGGGVSVSSGVTLSAQQETGASGCLTSQLDPNTCQYFEYEFECCVLPWYLCLLGSCIECEPAETTLKQKPKRCG